MSGSDQFAREVLDGLQSNPKTLSSKYFYDERGNRLFQQIMKLPEYYLTGCEFEILQACQTEIAALFGQNTFDLIELGAGDGYKTKILLTYFLETGADFRFIPIDISEAALGELRASLGQEIPSLAVMPMQGEYFQVLETMRSWKDRAKLILFLGSNIGNLTPQEAVRFLTGLRQALSPGDHLLLGVDLKKDPGTVLAAYNDPTGVTAAFNLNLLSRINRELQADFNLDQFFHWETYDPVSGAARSYLVSREAQQVFLGYWNQTIHFQPWEGIYVERSQKYHFDDLAEMADRSGFEILRHFTDTRGYFADSLWRVPA